MVHVLARRAVARLALNALAIGCLLQGDKPSGLAEAGGMARKATRVTGEILVGVETQRMGLRLAIRPGVERAELGRHLGLPPGAVDVGVTTFAVAITHVLRPGFEGDAHLRRGNEGP